jgi:hypothetical protein
MTIYYINPRPPSKNISITPFREVRHSLFDLPIQIHPFTGVPHASRSS